MRITPQIQITLNEISECLNCPAKPYYDNRVLAFTTDSREIQKGDVFIALDGDLQSGELYKAQAKEKGAYVISKSPNDSDFTVNSTPDALLKIARCYKTKFKKLSECIAITGSVGKTTTKNIVADMLSLEFKVHKTHENFNNYLGVFHTVMTMPRDTELLVCEIGMNHAKEIEPLSIAITPTVSIITNIGSAHIGNLGSKKAIRDAKIEILRGMNTVKAIVPYEETLLEEIQGRYTVSLSNKNADCFIEIKALTDEYSIVDIHAKSYDIFSKKINVPGIHVLNSIGSGILVCDLLKLGVSEVESAIDAITPHAARGMYKKIGKYTVYDDSYSSSPEALVAVLKLLSLKKQKKISCILGDMLELGAESEKYHNYIGKMVSEFNIDKLFTFGPLAETIAQSAVKYGMDPNKVFRNPDLNNPEATAKQISNVCDDNEIILCKASHLVDAGRILQYLNNT